MHFPVNALLEILECQVGDVYRVDIDSSLFLNFPDNAVVWILSFLAFYAKAAVLSLHHVILFSVANKHQCPLILLHIAECCDNLFSLHEIQKPILTYIHASQTSLTLLSLLSL